MPGFEVIQIHQMKKVEIFTAQNVSIDLEIAGLGQRVLAFLLDISMIGFSVIVSVVFLGIVLGDGVFYLLLAVVPFYSLIFELVLSGQTPGKRAMKIRVVDVYGQAPSGLDLFIRWAFRLVDIWLSLGTLALVMISTSPRGRRLGGVLGNTMVIKVGDATDLTLQDILSIEDRDSYKPLYSGVYRFEERDMLTVKSVIDRYHKYHNKAHRQLLEVTARRCSEVLELDELPTDQFKFLRTVLRDYIVITRS